MYMELKRFSLSSVISASRYSPPQAPVYSSPAAAYYQAPPPAYAPPSGPTYAFIPYQTFPDAPPRKFRVIKYSKAVYLREVVMFVS